MDINAIRDIIAELTLDEKLGMIHGNELFRTKGVERLNIPPLTFSDGPMGVRLEFMPDSWDKINLSDDYVSYLPCNSAIAATFNRKMAYISGSVLGNEARGRGKDVILAPGVNVKRSPLCGRNFEYFSEDPYLIKEMCVQYIKGVQQWDVAACVKHFLANNQETDRHNVDTIIDEATIREIYLPAFVGAIRDGGCYCLMGSYNKINGSFGSYHKKYLDEYIRDELRYDGLIISDWGAVKETKEAAESALDVEMSITDNFDEYYFAKPLKEMILRGEIDESVIDEKVEHCLLLMDRLHMLDGLRKSGSYNLHRHHDYAYEIAAESYVLLKNDNKHLPLDKKVKKILVVGSNANKLHALGGGSAEIKAFYEISPLLGIKSLLGGNTIVDYAQGYSENIYRTADYERWQERSLDIDCFYVESDEEAEKKMSELRKILREEAVKKAKDYDEIIYVGGLDHTPGNDCEGEDRKSLKLPYEQDELIKQLLAINPNTVVVMIGGSAIDMSSWIDNCNSLIYGYYAGMESGSALAAVIFGDVNPSGHLPETFYSDLSQCGAHALGDFGKRDRVEYKDKNLVGYRYVDYYGLKPLFPFGYGLSYTDYKITDCVLDYKDSVVDVTIKNVGDRAGKVLACVYMKGNEGELVKVLCGFEKVLLEPGSSDTVTIKVTEGMDDNHEYFVEI